MNEIALPSWRVMYYLLDVIHHINTKVSKGHNWCKEVMKKSRVEYHFLQFFLQFLTSKSTVPLGPRKRHLEIQVLKTVNKIERIVLCTRQTYSGKEFGFLAFILSRRQQSSPKQPQNVKKRVQSDCLRDANNQKPKG